MRDFARLSELIKPLIIELNCKTRILVVLDGLTFGASDFGLSEALATVEAASTTDHPVEITRATRSSVDPDADVLNFTFDGTHTVDGDSRTLDDYEEIWIIGIGSGPSIPVAERDAVEAFMDDGGGVFATGDHNELGAAMSADIKRVKSMRKWRNSDGAPDGLNPVAVPGSTSGRIDTTVPNAGVISDFDLQEDHIPQRIYPRYYEASGVVSAHEVLTRHDVDGPITFLPDHAHEGLIVEPTTLDTEEFPNGIAPEIIAWGVSGGAGGKPAVVPSLFGVVGAYDGHQASVGRIVVDATWHHFVNINLVGSPFGTLPGLASDGLSVGGVDTPEYEQIKDYFQNIAGWLEPNHVRWCFFIRWWFTLVYDSPVLEELLILDKPGLDELIAIGGIARKSLPELERQRMVELSIRDLDIDPRVRAMVSPTTIQGNPRFRAFPRISPLLDRGCVQDAVLGSIVWQLFDKLGPEPDKAVDGLREVLRVTPRDHDITGFAELVQEGALRGFEALEGELGRPNGGLSPLRRALPAARD